MNEYEEILMLDEEPDEITKKAYRFSFPVLSIGENANKVVYFNRFASDYFVKNGVKAIKWFTTSQYVIIAPSEPNAMNAFKLRCRDGCARIVTTTMPIGLLKDKKLMPGLCRLIRYKDGFAFKRYERLEEGEQ